MSYDNYRSRRGKLTLRARTGPCVLAVILTVTACAPSDGGPNVYATYQASSSFGEGDGALLTGTLVEKDGCLLVEEEGGGAVLPVFPSDSTTWDASTSVLRLDGAEHRLGSQVSFGGGYTSSLDEDGTVPEACGDPEEAFIVSSAAASSSQ